MSQSDITYRLRGIPDHYGKAEVSQLVARLLGLDVGTVWVRSLAGHPFRETEQVATLNLQERPTLFENGTNEWLFRDNNPHQDGTSDIVFDTNFDGITPLHHVSDEDCDTWYVHLHYVRATEGLVVFTDNHKAALLSQVSTRTLLAHSNQSQTALCGSGTRCQKIYQTPEYTSTAMIPA